jgi:hypothetical protein
MDLHQTNFPFPYQILLKEQNFQEKNVKSWRAEKMKYLSLQFFPFSLFKEASIV